jgi:hypothetical protein
MRELFKLPETVKKAAASYVSGSDDWSKQSISQREKEWAGKAGRYSGLPNSVFSRLSNRNSFRGAPPIVHDQTVDEIADFNVPGNGLEDLSAGGVKLHYDPEHHTLYRWGVPAKNMKISLPNWFRGSSDERRKVRLSLQEGSIGVGDLKGSAYDGRETTKKAEFVDTPYGKVHKDDAHFLAGHLDFGDPDDPMEARDALIARVSSAKKPEYKPGIFPSFRQEAKKKNHADEVASWERTRNPEYLKRVASDFVANGEAGVF